jgi:hypothetical protein
MTIASSTARQSFVCNGVTTLFAVNIQAYLNTDFLVIASNTNTGLSTTLVLNSDYTLVASGTNAPPFWNLTTQTGQLTSPYATGYTLQVILNPVDTQLTQYVQGEAFPSLAIQTNFDRLTQMIIREGDQLSRAIAAPDGDVSPIMQLPAANLRKSTYLGFDSNANVALFNLLTAGTVLSTAVLAPFLGLSQTAAESAAGVTPVNLQYQPGIDLRYGVVRDDATDNQTALTNAIAVAKQANGPTLVLTPGIARHSGTLNWGFQNLSVVGSDDSFLRYTGGVGPANLIDGGAASAVYSLYMDSVYELGNANATYCWDIRSVHRSKLFLRAKNCTASGFRFRFGVLNWMDLRCSQNDGVGSFTTQPVNGVIFDVRNAGEGVAFSLPSHIIVEGVSGTGFLTQNTAGSGTATIGGMYSGASEGNGTGVATDTASLQITFQDFDCEGNLTNTNGCDWNIQGQQHQLINTNSTSSAATDSTYFSNSEQLTLRGGYHRSVNVQSTALDTLFLGVGTSDNGALGFHGPGTFRQVSTVKYNTATPRVATLRPADILGEVGTWTPTIVGGTTPGTQTYAANGQLGYWSRCGRIVKFTIWFNLTANGGGAAGNATVLLPMNGANPLTSRNAINCYQTFAVGEFTGVTLPAVGQQLGFRIPPNSSTGILVASDSGAAITPIAITSIAATANIVISGSYEVDAGTF